MTGPSLEQRERDLRAAVVAAAEATLAVRENPKGSNRAPEIDRWLIQVGSPLGSPWCAAAGYDWIKVAGVPLALATKSGRVQDWVDLCPEIRQRPASDAKAGDIVVFFFPSLGRYAHFGVCTGRKDGLIQTIEGNTIAVGDQGNSREGYGVFRHAHSPSSRLLVLTWSLVGPYSAPSYKTPPHKSARVVT